GNAVDFERGLRNIAAASHAVDMVLHIATQAGHRMRQRTVHLDPVLHELLVAPAVFAGQQADRLDHVGVPPDFCVVCGMIRSIAIVVALLFAAEASAQSVRFPSVAVGGAGAGPELSGWIYRPAGGGPFPGMVLAHPCGGISDHTTVWGKLLSSWGYVVVAPDSVGPRGEKSVCGRSNVVNGNMRVADVAGAIDFLNAQPFVRRGQIGLIGHSHGGWTVMRAVQQSYDLAARGLKAAVAYYPSCAPQFD